MAKIKYTEQSAVISSGGHYRYELRRKWLGGTVSRAVWVMLNPSTADGSSDDATIRRCVGFSQRWGMSMLSVVNLFAFRARNPRVLRQAIDPIGPENDHYIAQACLQASIVVCAWGACPTAAERAAKVLRLIESIGCDPHALALTKSGEPGHPLFISYEAKPFSIFGTSGAQV